jgi:hypothetical protein
MRYPGPTEADAWRALAQTHGFLDASGQVQLGRFVVEIIDGAPWARFITPLRPSPFTEALREKVPPIRFDRTVTGELRLPGRWWAHVFESLSQQKTLSEDVRALAARLAHEVDFPATLLPATTDTIVIEADGPQGRRVEFEALPPGTMLPIPLNLGPPEDAAPGT